jgi:hypothetical protein
MMLDCSNYGSIKSSLCSIFRADEDSLILKIRSIDIRSNYDNPPEDIIYSEIIQKFGMPNSDASVIWCHATRVEDEYSFLRHGILPKSSMRKILYPRLETLAEGLECEGKNPFSNSIFGKEFLGKDDEGPFAFLFKDVAIHAPGVNHSYVEAPEMVEDIAGTLLGQNFQQLVERFQAITKPFIVSFSADLQIHELTRALLYLKLVEDGYGHFEAASAANTFYTADGNPIPTSRIIKIEAV